MASEEETLEERIKELEEQVQTAQSQSYYTSEGLDNQIERLEALESRVGEMYRTLSRRLQAIEEEVDLSPEETTVSNSGSTEPLERLRRLPDFAREDLSAPLRRSVVVWEHFDPQDENPDWTINVRSGRKLPSGDLKRYLSTAMDKDFSYAQIHRVISTFDSYTSEQYIVSETDDGKAIIRRN